MQQERAVQSTKQYLDTTNSMMPSINPLQHSNQVREVGHISAKQHRICEAEEQFYDAARHYGGNLMLLVTSMPVC
jgi:hypothetical protein